MMNQNQNNGTKIKEAHHLIVVAKSERNDHCNCITNSTHITVSPQRVNHPATNFKNSEKVSYT